jgi:hypothetical protein
MITRMADNKIAIPISEYFIEFINIFEKNIKKYYWWNMLDTLLRIWSSIKNDKIYDAIIKVIESGGGIDRIDMNDIQDDTINMVYEALKIKKDPRVSELIPKIDENRNIWKLSANNDNILTKRKIPEQTDLSGFDYIYSKPESKKKKISTLIGKNLTNDYCDHCDTLLNKDNLGATTEINGVIFIVCSQNCSDKIFIKYRYN